MNDPMNPHSALEKEIDKNIADLKEHSETLKQLAASFLQGNDPIKPQGIGEATTQTMGLPFFSEMIIKDELTPPQIRMIDTHKVNGVNDGVSIATIDHPGPGGAHHHYLIYWLTTDHHSCVREEYIPFQKGGIKEKGINGLTHEILLAIVRDRLECFQAGPFKCPENAEALSHVIQAMTILKKRTERRMERGVEGTQKV